MTVWEVINKGIDGLTIAVLIGPWLIATAIIILNLIFNFR